MGYDQSLFVTLQLSNLLLLLSSSTRKHTSMGSLVPFFQFFLKNSELKTTHNTFRDCRVHFFRQPFSKQLYVFYCTKRNITYVFDQFVIYFSLVITLTNLHYYYTHYYLWQTFVPLVLSCEKTSPERRDLRAILRPLNGKYESVIYCTRCQLCNSQISCY